MSNQYSQIQRPSLTGIPLTALLVNPSDTANLPRIAKRLRILNESVTFQSITFVTVTDDEVVFSIPPQSLLFEDILTKRVNRTGTGLLTIHAYLD